MNKAKLPIFMNVDNLSGYVGLRCSNPKITCTYMNGKKPEERKYYDKVIAFTIDEGILKAKIVDYKRQTEQKLFDKIKILNNDLVEIKKILIHYI